MKRTNSKISAIPYVVTFNAPTSGSVPYYLHIAETKFVSIKNNTSVSSASNKVYFGFSELFTDSGTMGVIDNGESFTGEVNFKDLYIIASGSNPVDVSLIIGVTQL